MVHLWHKLLLYFAYDNQVILYGNIYTVHNLLLYVIIINRYGGNNKVIKLHMCFYFMCLVI